MRGFAVAVAVAAEGKSTAKIKRKMKADLINILSEQFCTVESPMCLMSLG
jgi:hypothetical protein